MVEISEGEMEVEKNIKKTLNTIIWVNEYDEAEKRENAKKLTDLREYVKNFSSRLED